MSDGLTKVLLVGEPVQRSAALRKWLAQRACRCRFVLSFQDACRLLSQTEFDLVLCQYNLPDRTAFPLLHWLTGSHATLVFSARSRRGSRWLPVIERGNRCLGWPLLQARDLTTALEEILGGSSESAAAAESFDAVGPTLYGSK
jgi:CheY-like chemotaxis protein